MLAQVAVVGRHARVLGLALAVLVEESTFSGAKVVRLTKMQFAQFVQMSCIESDNAYCILDHFYSAEVGENR